MKDDKEFNPQELIGKQFIKGTSSITELDNMTTIIGFKYMDTIDIEHQKISLIVEAEKGWSKNVLSKKFEYFTDVEVEGCWYARVDIKDLPC